MHMRLTRVFAAVVASSAALVGLSTMATASDPVTLGPGGLTVLNGTTGHVDMLLNGLHVYTTSGDHMARLLVSFPIDHTLAQVAAGNAPAMSWGGTEERPNIDLGLDVDGDSTVDGTLTNEQGSDVWTPRNFDSDVVLGSTPSTLQAWSDALPAARAIRGGFYQDCCHMITGFIGEMTYADTMYVFHALAPTVTAVTGDVTISRPSARTVQLALHARGLGVNQTEGRPLAWHVVVDGYTALSTEQHAGDDTVWKTRFAAHTGTHTVKVYRNGSLLRTVTVSTR